MVCLFLLYLNLSGGRPTGLGCLVLPLPPALPGHALTEGSVLLQYLFLDLISLEISVSHLALTRGN